MHPDLIIRFNAARRYQAHVDGCGSGAAYAGDTDAQSNSWNGSDPGAAGAAAALLLPVHWDTQDVPQA